MISEAKWKATRGEAAGRRLARTAQLAIAAAAFLILSVLPIQAQTETVLYSFAGGPTDGGTPSGSLVRDASGNLYGTTQIGGASGAGTVFELVASENFKEKELYSFGATSGDGQLPVTGLVVDGIGNLFGTTQAAAAQRPASSGAEPCLSWSIPPGATPRRYCTVSRATRVVNRRELCS